VFSWLRGIFLPALKDRWTTAFGWDDRYARTMDVNDEKKVFSSQITADEGTRMTTDDSSLTGCGIERHIRSITSTFGA